MWRRFSKYRLRNHTLTQNIVAYLYTFFFVLLVSSNKIIWKKLFNFSMSRNDLFTRVIVLNWLSTLRPYVAADHTFVVQFLEALKGTYMDLAVLTTYKQFSNSLSHRQKHRMSLVFLLLADFITKVSSEALTPPLTWCQLTDTGYSVII